MAGKHLFVAALGLTAVMLSACSIQRAQEASEAQASMVGMQKERVLACMGAPAHNATVGATEVWTYNSGGVHGDPDNGIPARYCKVDIVMSDDRVSRVNYSGPTGGLLSKGEQCAYAVDNCLH